jgi:murein DD-endopeptidase MepM/ murein hydrolase activator NlpD
MTCAPRSPHSSVTHKQRKPRSARSSLPSNASGSARNVSASPPWRPPGRPSWPASVKHGSAPPAPRRRPQRPRHPAHRAHPALDRPLRPHPLLILLPHLHPAPAPSAGGAGQVNGSVACPVGQPRNYSDTWGAARSGGRSHKGTDILAPRGTPIYAYENGTITRMNSNSLGGISLYLRGSSGNVYYYTHLQGYVSGLSAGQSVSVGQHIAFNGDTGNARGIPHLHFEVMPGGGSNVNPYPYVKRACG